MARKSSTYQPLLPFPDPDDTPTPDDNITAHAEGDHHAIQDDSARTPPAEPGAARAAAQGAEAASHGEPSGDRAEGPPPSLEAPPVPGDAGQRPEPDRERCPGDRP